MMRGSKLPLLLRVLRLKRKNGKLIKSARWVFVLLNSISPSFEGSQHFFLHFPFEHVSANINVIKIFFSFCNLFSPNLQKCYNLRLHITLRFSLICPFSVPSHQNLRDELSEQNTQFSLVVCVIDSMFYEFLPFPRFVQY